MANFVQIFDNKSAVLKSCVTPNVIHNRFDLLYGDEYELYDIGDIVVPVKKINDHLKVGLYLVNGNENELNAFLKQLFKLYSGIKYIEIKHCYVNLCNAESYPYWHIELPDDVETFNKSLTARVRYNTKWYPKKVIKDIGQYIITKYTANEIPDEAMKLYFAWKKQSHGFVWKSDYKDYIKSSGITHGYVMYIGNKVSAMGFICDTGDNVYFENFSYDIEYRKYSLGMIVYYYIICDMIKAKKRIMYLSGGWLDYKKWYNGTLTYTFSGRILRQSKYQILRYIKNLKFW